MIYISASLAIFLTLFSAFGASLPSELTSFPPHHDVAVANSLRCLETSSGDYERIAKLRNWVADNLAYFGNGVGAHSILRGTRPHYHVPTGCVDAAVTLLGHPQQDGVKDLLSLALEVLPYAVGYSPEVVQFQILQVATLTHDSSAIQNAWEAEKLTGAKLSSRYQSFLQDLNPNLWNTILDRLFPNRHWPALGKKVTRDEEISWKSERSVDYFTGLLLVRLAELRVRSKESYPSSWIQFVQGGIRAPSFNTRPAVLSSELAELARLEGRPDSSLQILKETWALLNEWAPQMTGTYKIERDLAVTLAALTGCQATQEEAVVRLAKRSELAWKQLNEVEQMYELPLLAEGFHALGEEEQAQKNWKIATEMCLKNQNPQSQSAGLTRIWMSYARANTWPTKEIEALLQKIEKQLPAAYAKVNF